MSEASARPRRRPPRTHRRAAQRRRRTAARLPGRRRAGPPVRRGRPRAAPGRRFGARRAARPARRRPRLLPPTPTPTQTLRIVKGWAEAIWETGREFGTIGAQRDGLRLEITTFRAEAYDRVSRNPVVRVRHQPRSTTCSGATSRSTRWRSACPDHEFTDPYGGLADLAAKVIRTPGTPGESFGDDPLRMLRAARFAAQLRFAVAPDVRAAMTEMAADLDRITAERIRDEFTKLLCGADPITGLRLLVDTGLADRFLPELTGLKLEIDEHAQHKDVYEHTLTVVAQRDRPARTDGPRLRAADGRADARHRQAGDQGGRPGRPGQLPPPRGGRRPADQGSG